jgi:hypothetical protein
VNHVFIIFIKVALDIYDLLVHVLDNNCLFLFFIYLAGAGHKEWSLWNSFTFLDVFFLIIMYSSHDCCLYSSYLIRSSNHADYMFYFMLLIKLTKYRPSLFSTIVDYNSSTCLLIESSLENCNRLTWNTRWIFNSDDSLSLYV